jgi:hypothetical protein
MRKLMLNVMFVIMFYDCMNQYSYSLPQQKKTYDLIEYVFYI